MKRITVLSTILLILGLSACGFFFAPQLPRLNPADPEVPVNGFKVVPRSNDNVIIFFNLYGDDDDEYPPYDSFCYYIEVQSMNPTLGPRGDGSTEIRFAEMRDTNAIDTRNINGENYWTIENFQIPNFQWEKTYFFQIFWTFDDVHDTSDLDAVKNYNWIGPITSAYNLNSTKQNDVSFEYKAVVDGTNAKTEITAPMTLSVSATDIGNNAIILYSDKLNNFIGDLRGKLRGVAHAEIVLPYDSDDEFSQTMRLYLRRAWNMIKNMTDFNNLRTDGGAELQWIDVKGTDDGDAVFDITHRVNEWIFLNDSMDNGFFVNTDTVSSMAFGTLNYKADPIIRLQVMAE